MVHVKRNLSSSEEIFSSEKRRSSIFFFPCYCGLCKKHDIIRLLPKCNWFKLSCILISFNLKFSKSMYNPR